jgi:hypothetical protein
MSCRKGGLIIHRHNDLVSTWGQLCSQALTPSTVSDEPLIQPSRDVPVAGTNCTVPSPELRGDLAVHGFWTKGQTAIFDVRITDTDQPTNRKIDPAKVLLRHEKEKKNKYGDLCIARRRTFTPLVFSIDGLLGKKPLLLRSILHPLSLANGNVHTQRFVALSVQDFLLPWFALQVVA